SAQPKPPPPPEALGDLHTKIVDSVVQTAGRGENRLESPTGLRRLIASLVDYKVLSQPDAEAIIEAIARLEEVMSKGTPLKVALDQITSITNRIAKTAGAAARGIMGILQASVRYAAAVESRLSDGEKANIVLKDLSGCLAGGVAALLAGHPEFLLL